MLVAPSRVGDTKWRYAMLGRVPVTRRTALAAAGVALVGCTDGQTQGRNGTPTPTADAGLVAEQAVLRAAVEREEVLLGRYLGLRLRHPRLAAALSAHVAEHEAHLAELKSRLPERTVSPVPTASPTTQEATADPRAALRSIAAAERSAARSAAGAIVGVSADLARLLASIGASEAQHAALVDLLAPGLVKPA